MSNACFSALYASLSTTTRSVLSSSCSRGLLHGSRTVPLPTRAASARFLSIVSPQPFPISRPAQNNTSPFHRPSRSFHSSNTCLARRTGPPTPKRAPQRTPSGGVQIPFAEQSSSQLVQIFGTEVDQELGNKVLRTLHQRRVTGSLVDRGATIENANVAPDACLAALQWLRANHPVDEQEAASQWAEQEAARLENQYISRAERLGLYQKAEKDKAESVEVGPGESVIDQMRRYNEAREKREEEARRISGEAQRSEETRVANITEAARQKVLYAQALRERRKKQVEAGMVSTDEDIPDISTSERLLAPTVFAVLCVAYAIFATELYTPPELENRIFKDYPMSWATVSGIAGSCLTITLLWYWPPTWRYFNRYLVTVPAYPYAVSLLGNVFSHQKLSHLAINMVGLYTYGISLHEDVGRGNFLAIYLSGGILGSLLSLWTHTMRGVMIHSSMGASGGLWAVMTAWAYLNLQKPMPSPESYHQAFDVFRYVFIAVQIPMHFVRRAWSKFDVVAHLGGAITGIVGAWLLSWRARRKTDGSVQQKSRGNRP